MTEPTRQGLVFDTRNNLYEDARLEVVEVLNQTLADTTDLMTQFKYAHWNVKGMQFFQLHELFDEIAELLTTHGDVLAERATALGGQARGTVRMAASTSRIEPIPADAVTGPEYVEHLADRLGTHAAYLREDIDRTMDIGDADTSDLYTELSREVDKHLWFLEAHLQEAAVETRAAGSAGAGAETGAATGSGTGTGGVGAAGGAGPGAEAGPEAEHRGYRQR